MPARIAAQRRQSQHPRQNRQRPGNIVRRNLLQFQVAANSTPRVTHVTQRHCPGVESFLTLYATPRNHPRDGQKIIDRQTAARAAAAARMANRANHRGSVEITVFGVLYFIIDRPASARIVLIQYIWIHRHGPLHRRTRPRRHKRTSPNP